MPVPETRLPCRHHSHERSNLLSSTSTLDTSGDPSSWLGQSQNHRMLGVGRDLCRSSSPPPLPKQGHLEWAAQDLVQVDLEYLQRRRMHNLSGQPVPVLCRPQSKEGKKVSKTSSCPAGTSCASVCAHCPLSCRWAPLKRAWPHPLDTHPSGICKHL